MGYLIDTLTAPLIALAYYSNEAPRETCEQLKATAPDGPEWERMKGSLKDLLDIREARTREHVGRRG